MMNDFTLTTPVLSRRVTRPFTKLCRDALLPNSIRITGASSSAHSHHTSISCTTMSSPTRKSNDKRLSNSSMDPAEFIQNRQHFITFPRTDTAWTIVSNVTDTYENPQREINSFLQPVVFKVLIGSVGSRKSMQGIPKTAIIKVQSL